MSIKLSSGDAPLDLTTSSIASAITIDVSTQAATKTPANPTRPQRPPITKAIDVWALGVTLYCFIFGRCPFIADTEFDLFFNVIPRKPLEFPEEIPITNDLKDLLMRLLEKDPFKRITLEEVKKHPWVVADLPNSEKWREETDPKKYQPVIVTEEDVKGAYTLIDRLKKKFRKISVSLENLTIGNLRKRSKSISGSALSEDDLLHRTSPIPIQAQKNRFLEANLQPQSSLYGSSFPEMYAHQRSKEVESLGVDDDETSLSSSSSHSTLAPSATSSQQAISDHPDYHQQSRLIVQRHFSKKRNDSSHSSLNQNWALNIDETEPTSATEVGLLSEYDEEFMSCSGKSVNNESSSQAGHVVDNNGRTRKNFSSVRDVSPTIANGSGHGSSDVDREGIEIIDTIESDEDDGGVVFCANATRGWYNNAGGSSAT